MLYLLDSVNYKDIDKYKDIIIGATSNPILLKNANIKIYDFLKYVLFEQKLKAFVQVFSKEEAKDIIENFKYNMDDIVFKVVMHPEYFELIKYLKLKGAKISSTSMYNITQLNQSVNFELDYSMVYYHKNINRNFIKEANEFDTKKTKLIGASFRTREEVEEIIKLKNITMATVPTVVMGLLFNDEQVIRDMDTYKKDYIV